MELCHGWYRHNGERRRIRPIPGLPIDILGSGGFCIASPSRGPPGSYEIIQGTLDDLDRLPVMRNVPEVAQRKVMADHGEQLVLHGTRNTALFDACRKTACDRADEADLTAFAVKWNAQHCQPPVSLSKVMDTVHSVWKWETKRRSLDGRAQRAEALLRRSANAAALLHLLIARHKPGVQFELTNTYAAVIGWDLKRFTRARAILIDVGEIEQVRGAYPGQPALYRRPTLFRSRPGGGVHPRGGEREGRG